MISIKINHPEMRYKEYIKETNIEIDEIYKIPGIPVCPTFCL